VLVDHQRQHRQSAGWRREEAKRGGEERKRRGGEERRCFKGR